MDAKKIPKAVLVGHSLGGIFLQDFAVAYPERVMALVLSNVQARHKDTGGKVPEGIAKRIAAYGDKEANRKIFEDELDRTLKQYEMIQGQLLAGETPQLGSASLQEIVRRLSEKDGVGIRSFRMLEPKEIDSYRKISIQIDFNPNNSMLNLGQFIYDIETKEFGEGKENIPIDIIGFQNLILNLNRKKI
jgi:pimeloyl-ACP methyl ester carboxylesterase